MAWTTGRLIDLSQRSKRPYESEVAPKFQLPDDVHELTVRSRRVFYEMAKAPLDDRDGQPEFNTHLMKRALDKCGLDGETYAAMYELSKWAKKGYGSNSLSLAEFQSVVERFSGPIRIRNQMRRRVNDYMTDHGFGFVYMVD